MDGLYFKGKRHISQMPFIVVIFCPPIFFHVFGFPPFQLSFLFFPKTCGVCLFVCLFSCIGMKALLFFLAVRVYGFVGNFQFQISGWLSFCNCNSSLTFSMALAFNLDKLQMHYLLLRFGGSDVECLSSNSTVFQSRAFERRLHYYSP